MAFVTLLDIARFIEQRPGVAFSLFSAQNLRNGSVKNWTCLQSSQKKIVIVDLGEMVPKTHLLKRIDSLVDLSLVFEKAENFYSSQGSPSIDLVLLIKMLLIGYLYGIKSERRLEDEVSLNLVQAGIMIPMDETRNSKSKYNGRHESEKTVQRRIQITGGY